MPARTSAAVRGGRFGGARIESDESRDPRIESVESRDLGLDDKRPSRDARDLNPLLDDKALEEGSAASASFSISFAFSLLRPLL